MKLVINSIFCLQNGVKVNMECPYPSNCCRDEFKKGKDVKQNEPNFFLAWIFVVRWGILKYEERQIGLLATKVWFFMATFEVLQHIMLCNQPMFFDRETFSPSSMTLKYRQNCIGRLKLYFKQMCMTWLTPSGGSERIGWVWKETFTYAGWLHLRTPLDGYG